MTRFVESGTRGRIRKTQSLGAICQSSIFGIFRMQKYIAVSVYKQGKGCKDEQKRVRDYVRPAVRNWVRTLEASMSKRIEDEMGQRRKRCRNESLRLAALSS